MTTKRLVFIPHWIAETLKRSPDASLITCLSLPKLRPLLSVNDLVGFMALQYCTRQIFGLAPEDHYTSGGLWETWNKSIPQDQVALRDFFSGTLLPLERDKSVVDEIKSRLFSPDAKLDQYKEPFICYDLTAEVCGVVINPGFFVGDMNTPDHQLSLLRKVLEVLYVYDTYSEVAKTSLFKRYLELLAQT